MNDDLRIPILIQRVADLATDVDLFHQRISRRAYELFVNRGEEAGQDLEDWLIAERELMIQSDVNLEIENRKVVAVITVENVEPMNLLAKITPYEMLLLSGPDDSGRRVFRQVRFPQEIDLSGVEAEHQGDSVIVFARICDSQDATQTARQVA